jgi:hypothetical protein
MEADYWVWVATSDQEPYRGFDPSEVRAAFCWSVKARSGEHIADDWNLCDASRHDYHAGLILPAATAAMEHVPEGHSVHVFSDVKFFTDKLDIDPSTRISTGYKRKDKKPLAYHDAWRTIDAVVARRSLIVSAGRPPESHDPFSLSWRVARELERVKANASKTARNIGLSFSDWDL